MDPQESPRPGVHNRLKRRSTLIITLITVLILGLLWLIRPAPDNLRRVVKTAPQIDNPLLEFGQHISLAPRPLETFAFPIALGQVGPVNSLYAGPLQYPFYCMSVESGLEQPLVDNQQGLGVPVYQSLDTTFDSPGPIIGYSKDCLLPSRMSYFLIGADGRIEPIDSQQPPELQPGEVLVRVEQGTINRFIYSIAMPISIDELGQRLAQSRWNKRLIYQFNGGVGIGYRQGKQRASRVISRRKEQLRRGYAVISSSGNKTSYTYNMLLAEDTARRVKRQFTSLYGDPLYTVATGGSGGGLSQYLIGQNSRGILDGLIPLYSYPDMITQTNYALDCDLLSNYFSFRSLNTRWHDWRLRQRVEGMNSLNDREQERGYLQPLNQLMAGLAPRLPNGNNECINGYFGLASLINNPRQGFIKDYFSPAIEQHNRWSYWQDLAAILGTDQRGFGLSSWDNVGVQYGLAALQQGQISFDEFIDLNRQIGGWKPQSQMQPEHIIWPLGNRLPLWLSLWSRHNITEVRQGLAGRHQGSIEAMQAAYRSGQVFIGKLELPVIDIRHYLEDELDMHHVAASFFSRIRIQQAQGNSDHQLIWVADPRHDPVQQAFELMDLWLLDEQGQRRLDPLSAKPQALQDSCFDHDGRVIAQGPTVWNGEWNNQPLGPCQQHFPVFTNSRIQAGAPWHGLMFKCALMSVEQAFKQGLYGPVDQPTALAELSKTFPDGVCDYSQPDQGLPPDFTL